MPPTDPLLELIEVGRRHPSGDRWLLHSVSLAVEPGERIAVVGSSGSGKTLLLRAMAMLDPIDRGEIRWQQRRVADHRVPDFRSQVIYLHQKPALAEPTVEAVLRRPFDLGAHAQRRFDRARAVDLLAQLGWDESFLTKPVETLSGGELQATALARALQLEPALLLLDEPTAAMDPHAEGLCADLLHRWAADSSTGRALVWVTHKRHLRDRVATRRLEVHEGRVRA